MKSAVKHAAISLGLYKPARALYSVFRPDQRRALREYRDLMSGFLKPGDLAFDVGANIGIRSEAMLSLGARVIAFEPQPDCAREVAARGNERLTVVEKAVGSREGFADLHLKRDAVQASLVENWQGGPDVGTITVPVTTLDLEIENFGIPAFCKIDVEGFETEVINGLSIPIPALSVEYHCDQVGVEKLKAVLDRLGELGNYEANLVGQEEHRFLNSSWLPADRFVRSFPQIARGNFWGDCFVRLMG